MATQNVSNEQIAATVEQFFVRAKDTTNDYCFSDLIRSLSNYLAIVVTPRVCEVYDSRMSWHREGRWADEKEEDLKDVDAIVAESLENALSGKISTGRPDDKELQAEVLRAAISIKDNFATNYVDDCISRYEKATHADASDNSVFSY
jgi:hypothetical protein